MTSKRAYNWYKAGSTPNISGDDLKTEESVVINDHVKPPVTIRTTRVFSFSTFNVNRYEIDSEEKDSSSLTAIERGHVYACTAETGEALPAGSLFYRVASLRTCDSETANLVKGLESLRNGDLALAKNPKYSATANKPKALNFEFLLSEDDFKTFEERVDSISGKLIHDRVSRDDLQTRYDFLEEVLEAFNAKYAEVQAKIGDLKNTSALPEFQTALELLDNLEKLQLKIYEEQNYLGESVEKAELLRMEPSILTYLQALITAAKAKVGKVRIIRANSLRQEVKTRMEASLSGADVKTEDLYPLMFVFEKLAKDYSVLRHFSIKSNNEVWVELSGVTFKLSSEKAEVEGSLAALQKLIGGVSFVKDPAGGRFANID